MFGFLFLKFQTMVAWEVPDGNLNMHLCKSRLSGMSVVSVVDVNLCTWEVLKDSTVRIKCM